MLWSTSMLSRRTRDGSMSEGKHFFFLGAHPPRPPPKKKDATRKKTQNSRTERTSSSVVILRLPWYGIRNGTRFSMFRIHATVSI